VRRRWADLALVLGALCPQTAVQQQGVLCSTTVLLVPVLVLGLWTPS
jgi:hypothetical protein